MVEDDWETRMLVYLASPLGFSEAGRSFYYGVLMPAIKACRVAVHDPWATNCKEEIERVSQMVSSSEKQEAWRRMNAIIGRDNVTAIDQCDLVVAVLDGVDVDSGTASEIGYAYAKGKRILGYRGDFRLASDNDGAVVNLQVEYFIRASGGKIVFEIGGIAHEIAEIGSSMSTNDGGRGTGT